MTPTEVRARLAVRRLPVVPVDRLASPAQRFRCEPYSVTLSARACLERQRLHGERVVLPPPCGLPGRLPWATQADPKNYRTMVRDFGRCGDCDLGRRVAARLNKETNDA